MRIWSRLVIDTAHLYEVRANRGKFDLYFKKKNGLKFKKHFKAESYAVAFAILYLRHCCLSCQQHGWVYKVKGMGHIAGNRHSNTYTSATLLFCPECRTEHRAMQRTELAAQIGIQR